MRNRNPSNFLGKKYGRLTVLKRMESEKRQGGHGSFSKWYCECECGGSLIVRRNSLISGTTKSCGCLRDEKNRIRHHNQPLGEAGAKRVYLGYLYGAIKRGKDFLITESEFKSINLMDCHYCGSPPMKVMSTGHIRSKFLYNGIDRKDNSKGYLLENCLPCCESCNKAKGTKSYEEFLLWIARLINYRSSL